MLLNRNITVIRNEHEFYYCIINRVWFNIDFGFPITNRKLKQLVRIVIKETNEMHKVFEQQKEMYEKEK